MNQNQLPPHWSWIKLGEVCDDVETVKRKEVNPEKEILYLDIGGLDNATNKIISHKNCKWKDAPSRAQQIVFKDDILFSTVRTYLKNIAIVDSSQYDGQIASSGFTVIRANKELVAPKFLFYYSLSRNFLQPLNELQTGSSYPAVRDKDVFAQPTPLPPLSEQHHIVAKIESLFSELDKGIENLKTAQQQLKVYRQAVLKWAFEGKLTDEWRRKKNGKSKQVRIQVGLKPSMAAEPEVEYAERERFELSFPEGWKWTKVFDLGKIETGTTPSKKNPEYYSSEFPFYKPTDLEAGNDVQNSIDGLSQAGIKEARFAPANSTLVTCIGATIGKTGLIKRGGGFNQQINAIIPSEEYDPKFIYYQTISPSFQDTIKENASATTLPILNKSKFSNLEMVVCSREEQHQIVSEIESRLSVCDKLETTIEENLQQAEALRQSILKKAFEGKLTS